MNVLAKVNKLAKLQVLDIQLIHPMRKKYDRRHIVD
jgi:hypothetical protein